MSRRCLQRLFIGPFFFNVMWLREKWKKTFQQQGLGTVHKTDWLPVSSPLQPAWLASFTSLLPQPCTQAIGKVYSCAKNGCQ